MAAVAGLHDEEPGQAVAALRLVGRVLREPLERDPERTAEDDRPRLCPGEEGVDRAGRFPQPPVGIGGSQDRDRRREHRGKNNDDDQELDQRERAARLRIADCGLRIKPVRQSAIRNPKSEIEYSAELAS